MTPLTLCIIIFIISIVLYATNKLPMGVVGLMTLAALIVCGCMKESTALSYFANKNVILLLSMFVVSTGLSRTSLIDKFSDTVTKLTG